MRIHASISGHVSFAVSVTITCIRPISASSDAANRSRVCLCHHAVDSGMSDGIAVPKSLVTGSGSSAADAVFFLNSRLFEFLKKSSAWINRDRYQNPVDRQNPAPPRTGRLPPSPPRLILELGKSWNMWGHIFSCTKGSSSILNAGNGVGYNLKLVHDFADQLSP